MGYELTSFSKICRGYTSNLSKAAARRPHSSNTWFVSARLPLGESLLLASSPYLLDQSLLQLVNTLYYLQ